MTINASLKRLNTNSVASFRSENARPEHISHGCSPRLVGKMNLVQQKKNIVMFVRIGRMQAILRQF